MPNFKVFETCQEIGLENGLKTFRLSLMRFQFIKISAFVLQPYEHFYLLLDQYLRRKYVIDALDHETPIANISYYYQYLTNTKYIHGLPYSISMSVVDESFLDNFRSFVHDLLLLEHSKESNFKESDPLKVRKLLLIKLCCHTNIF